MSPLLSGHPLELRVLCHLAPVAEDDRVQPQRLLDRRRDQLGLGDQSLPVLGVLDEVAEQVAQLPSCGVQAGEDEHGEDVQVRAAVPSMVERGEGGSVS